MTSCNKATYETADDARSDAKLLKAAYNRSQKKEIKKQRPYKCPRCKKYHLTSMSKREAKKAGYSTRL